MMSSFIGKGGGSPMNRRTVTVLAALAAALLVTAGCNKGDQIPSEGSTIDLAANPTTIVKIDQADCIYVGGAKCGTAEIVATVNSPVGVPLPDQDVRFSSTAGILYIGDPSNPMASLPIRTDSYGNARIELITTTTTTVNARSGTATGSLSLSTVDGNISQILLIVDIESAGCSGSTEVIDSCSQQVCFKATVSDTSGDPIPNVVVAFMIQNNTVGDENTFNVTFTPIQDISDVNGEVFTVMTPQSDCVTECGGGKACAGEVVASLQGGAFPSIPVPLSINIQ